MSLATRKDLLNLQLERNPNIIGATKNIWIAADRTNGGTGSIDSPYSANTKTKLDAIWAANQGPNINYYYLPGTYETTGYKDSPNVKTALPYQRHYGSGMYNTEIKLVDSSTARSDGIIFYNFWNATIDGFGVFDMTLNANNDNQPKKDLGLGGTACAGGTGNYVRFERVRFIGYGTNELGVECFCIAFGPSDVHAARIWEDIWYKSCRWENPGTDNHDGLTCSAIYGARFAPVGFHQYRNMGIEDCYYGDHSGNGFFYMQGFSGQHAKNCTFDIDDGIYLELTAPLGIIENLCYENNTFNIRNNGVGIFLRMGSGTYAPLENVTIQNNKFISLAGSTRGFAIGVDGPSNIGTVSNLIVKNNDFSRARGVATSSNMYGIGLANIKNGIITDNVFDLGASAKPLYTDDLSVSVNENLLFKRNYNTDGTLATITNIDTAWTNTE